MKCAHAKADVQCNSQAHKRRFKHFRDAAETVEADTDARTVLRAVAHGEKKQKPAEVEVEGQLSKRAQKRVCVSCSLLQYARTTKDRVRLRSQKAKLAAIKAKREKQKVMKAKHRAKKEAKLEAAAVNSSADSDDEADAESKDKSADKAPPSKKRKLERKPETAAEDKEDAGPKPAKKSKPKPTKSPMKTDAAAPKSVVKARPALNPSAVGPALTKSGALADEKASARAKKRRRSEPSES